MKFKVGDKVRVTSGKDKGKDGEVVRVLPEKNQVILAGLNMYVKHRRPMAGQAGQKLRLERPLPTAKIAILNDKGQPDRVGYQVAKDGSKTRVFKKSGATVPEAKQETKKKAKK